MARPGRLAREVLIPARPAFRGWFGQVGLLLVPAAMLVPFALAACGSVAGGNAVAPAISTGAASPSAAAGPSGAGSPSGAPAGAGPQRPGVCASQQSLTRLTIQRAGAIVRVPQEMFTLPPVTVRPAVVRSLARALCALPQHQPGTGHCPAGLGTAYKLRFSAGRQRFRVVTVDASGCKLVHGLGAVRSAARRHRVLDGYRPRLPAGPPHRKAGVTACPAVAGWPWLSR